MSNKTNDLLSEIVIKTWTDSEFKTRFLKDPISIFNDYGIGTNKGVKQIQIVENTEDIAYFVLPQKPDLAEISSEDLQNMASRLLEEQLVLPTILD